MIAREVIAGLVPEIGLDAEVAKKEYRPTPENEKNIRKPQCVGGKNKTCTPGDSGV